jgi:RHS repeat-associated protein
VQDTVNPSGYSQVLEQWQGGTTPAVSYVLGASVIVQNANGANSYLMPDGHGSTRQLTAYTSSSGTNGHVTGRYDYDAFGNDITFTVSTHPANVADTIIRYTGELWDAGSGTYDLRARDYRPDLGRFSTSDNIMITPGDLGNANLYLYVGGNPVMYSDPSGHDFGFAELMTNTLISQVLGGILGGSISGAYKFAKTGSWAMAGRAALEGAAYGALAGTVAGLGAGLFALGAVAAGSTAGVGFAAFGITAGIPMLGLSIGNLQDAYSNGDNVDKAFAWGQLVLSLATLGLSTYAGYSSLAAGAAGSGGTATVTQYQGTPLHMIVEVTNSGGESLGTHQVILSPDMSSTAIVQVNPADLAGLDVLASGGVDLPNAGAAMSRQQALMGAGDLGPYDKFMNSCVSHVCDVLNAGELPGVPEPGTSTQLKFLLKLVRGKNG